MSLTRRGFLGTTAATLAAAASVMAQPADELPIVDTHQHLWDLARFKLPWLKGAPKLGRSFLMEDYRQAIAGLWQQGSGTIRRPALEAMLFLPQRPYMILGSLRAQLLYPRQHQLISEAALRRVLAAQAAALWRIANPIIGG